MKSVKKNSQENEKKLSLENSGIVLEFWKWNLIFKLLRNFKIYKMLAYRSSFMLSYISLYFLVDICGIIMFSHCCEEARDFKKRAADQNYSFIHSYHVNQMSSLLVQNENECILV